MSNLACSPAAERNKQPILQVLQGVLPDHGRMLEIAAGTGQHAAWMAAGLPGWTWQPTEASAAALPTIAAWTGEMQAANVLPPCLLDVTGSEWPAEKDAAQVEGFKAPFDAMYAANLLHIAPWAACVGLMAGATRHLKPGGLLLIYGPFFETLVDPAPSNRAFDASLRAQDAAWGIRHREAVDQTAASHGLRQRFRIDMPANNLLLGYEPGPVHRP
jgi:hypothetical protein